MIPRERGGGERVEREALAAARLNHPAIVGIYELASDEHDVYLVSELVRGRTLAELLRAGAISDRDVARIGARPLRGAGHAHARGVIHRDVKPQNVMVVAEPAAGVGFAKLTDFGVAHLVSGDALTRTGDVVGTLAYMAPEQAEGARVTPACDVYSLALTLYEALDRPQPGARRRALPPPRAGSAARCPRSARLRRDLPRRALRRDRRRARRRPGRAARAGRAARRAARRRERAHRRGRPRRARDAAPRRPADHRPHRGLWRACAARRRDDARPCDRRSGCAARTAGPTDPPHRPARPRRARAPAGSPVRLARARRRRPARRRRRARRARARSGPSRPSPGSPPRALPRSPPRCCRASAGFSPSSRSAPGSSRPRPTARAPRWCSRPPRRPVPFLLPRAGLLWSVPVLAPLLGTVALAPAFVGVAALAPTPWRRAGLAAAGFWWLVLGEAITGQALLFGSPDGTLPRADWEGSISAAASDVARSRSSTSPALAPVLVWAAFAVALPLVVRGRWLAVDLVGAGVWAVGADRRQVALGDALAPERRARPGPRAPWRALAGGASSPCPCPRSWPPPRAGGRRDA